MDSSHLLIVPLSLLEGHSYLLVEKSRAHTRANRSVVTFVSYTACPAIVVVRNSEGVRHRCARECLVEARSLAHYIP